MRYVQTFSTPPYIQRLMDEKLAKAPADPRKGVPPGVERPPSSQRIIGAFLLLHRIPQKVVAEIITKTTGKTVSCSLLRNWGSEKSFIRLAARVADEIADFLFSEWDRCREYEHGIHQIGWSLSRLNDDLALSILRRVLDPNQGSETDRTTLFTSWYFSRQPWTSKKLWRMVKAFALPSEILQKLYRDARERFDKAKASSNWDMAEEAFQRLAGLAEALISLSPDSQEQ